MTGQTFTSLPNFNPYQLQSPIHSEPPSMHFTLPSAPPTQSSSSFSGQYSMPYQQPTYNPNFGGQPSMTYNPATTQSFPQQQFYSSQPFQPQQSVYQLPMHHQLSQPPPSQTIPTYHSGLQHPSIYQSQNFSDLNPPIQQSLPPLPAKFDPYRPQPVGAYDIPNPQQTIMPSHLINPQDIYRPGNLLGMNQTQIPSSFNNNNYDQNQFVQYIPSSSSASVSSSFANLSINSMSNH
jgi:hypothetical protein